MVNRKDKLQYKFRRLNDRFEYQAGRPDDVFRIVTIGDSFTFGLFVDTKDSYPELLEDMLGVSCQKKLEVINLGVGGYDMRYAVERYKIRGAKYNPDLVLWFVKDDDFSIEDFMIEREKYHKMQIGYEELKETAYKPSEPFLRATKDLKEKYSEEEILQYQADALNLLGSYYNGKLLLFTFPKTQNSYRQFLYQYAQSSENTFFYDGLPDIDTAGQIFPENHPNKQGYHSIAKSLFEYLTESKIIPCVGF